MMRTIKTEKQLQDRKKQLQKRQKELESLIHANWIEIKHNLKPKNVAGEFFSQAFTSKNEEGSSLLAESLSMFAAALTKTAVEKAEEHMSEWLRQKK
ncbi:MAG: hypothetical protein KGZ74_13440 [Chitinophagaceae bacterium]|nr:hypothetical protein [Chitinophagaceae bacterium]